MAWVSGSFQPAPVRAAATRERSARIAATRSPISASASMAAMPAAWAMALTANGNSVLSTGSDHVGVPDRVPDADAGEALRLRERSRDEDVGVIGNQLAYGIAVRRVEELSVRLVDHDDRARFDRRQQLSDLGRAQRRPSRVVRRREQHELGRRRHGSGNGVEVERMRRRERDRHCRPVHQLRIDRIDLERTPRVDDLVAGIDVREEELLEQTNRTGADGDPLDVDIEPARQPFAHRGRSMVGIAIGAGGGFGHRGQDRSDRRQRVLVGRQLDGVRDAVLGLRLCRALAGTVRRAGRRLRVGPDRAGSSRVWSSCHRPERFEVRGRFSERRARSAARRPGHGSARRCAP